MLIVLNFHRRVGLGEINTYTRDGYSIHTSLRPRYDIFGVSVLGVCTCLRSIASCQFVLKSA